MSRENRYHTILFIFGLGITCSPREGTIRATMRSVCDFVIILAILATVFTKTAAQTTPVSTPKTTPISPPCATLRFGILPDITNETRYFIDDLKNIKSSRYYWQRWLEERQVRSRARFFPNNCYNVKYKRIGLPREENNVQWLLDKADEDELSDVDVIIGEYRPSVYHYARKNPVAYILTTPAASTRVEQKIRDEKPRERVLFSAWPSWRRFFKSSMEALVRSRHMRLRHSLEREQALGRVLIINLITSERFSLATELLNVLINSGHTTWTKLISYGLQAGIEWPGWAIAHEIAESEPDIAVYLYEDKEQISVLQEYARWSKHDASSKYRKTEVYFWSLAQSVSGTWSALLSDWGVSAANYLELRAISPKLYLTFYGITCDSIHDDITPLVGGFDALKIVEQNAKDFISSAEFNRTVLLSHLRKPNRFLASTVGHDYVYPWDCYSMISGGMTFHKGFRYRVGQVIGRLSPQRVKRNDSDISGFGASDFDYEECDIKMEYRRYYVENVTTSDPVEIKEGSFLEDKNKTEDKGIVKVVVVLEEPFAMKKGATDFTGFTVEMVKEALDLLGKEQNEVIDYELYAAPGNMYGALDKKTGQWSGALGELQNGNAKIAVGMISKTIERYRYFEYSPPFGYVGLVYMQQKYKFPATIFNFMRPFERKIWYALLLTMFLSAIFIYILEYWNPFMDRVDDEHRFTWSEVMWYSFGTISCAGGSFAPVIYPTRIFSVFYWFFALILTASYTGNLASFLTESLEALPTGSIEDLGYFRGVKWATLKDSYMDSFIRTQNSSAYKRVGYEMTYVESYGEGVKMVKEDENNVFIGNGLLLSYYEGQESDCSLGLSPEAVAYTELAFPMANWAKSDKFYDIMIQMRDNGRIRDIQDYWIQLNYCGADDDDDHTKLDFDSFRGLFIILAAFIFASFVVLAGKLVSLKMRERNQKKGRGKSGSSEDVGSPMMVNSGTGDKEQRAGPHETRV